MSFDPRRLRGAEDGAAGSVPGEIDYRLARQNLISEFKKGRIDRQEVCDAQTELMRAARNVGEPSSRICPICEDAHVVLVSYAFGGRLPASGRCLSAPGELSKLARRSTGLACYVVEVCPECSWNHLARSFSLGGRAQTG